MSATTSKQFIAAKGYDYEGVSLNVYATDGDEGWEMCAVKLVGSDVDLIPLLSDKQIDHFDALVERRYLAYANDENDNAKVERALASRGIVELMHRAVFPGAPM
jgi:hypothetical protein